MRLSLSSILQKINCIQYCMQDCRYYTHVEMIPLAYGEQLVDSYPSVRFVIPHKVDLHNLTMQVKTHRILFQIPGNAKYRLVINMSEIMAIDGREEGMFKKQYFMEIATSYNDKIRVYLKNLDSALLSARGTWGKGTWKQVVQPKAPEQTTMFAGIYDRDRKMNSELQLKQAQMQQSFTSFETLYASIKQLKEVTTYVRDNLKLYDESLQQKTQIENILNEIGFVSSITKEQAGKNYYKEQAKRIFQICNTTLFSKFGGMVPLLDLFYLYNKKRQTCLIAPEELLKACNEMEKMGLAAKLVTYKGNIKMLESTMFDANSDFEKNFSQFFSFEKGVGADEISKRKGLPIVVVQIKIENALRRGRIVKDDRIEGVKYYNNMILAGGV